MATDEEAIDLNAERQKIKELQSEYARKKDQIKREDVKCRALVEELRERESELEKVKADMEKAKRKATHHKDGKKGGQAEAETEYMRDRVDKALQERIPVMAPDEESSDGDQAALEDMENQGEEPGKKENVHDTVLVKYVNIGQDNVQIDFNVSYRIDQEVTTEALHRDACAYWGCSHMDYLLCRILADGVAEQVYPKPMPPGITMQHEPEKVVHTSKYGGVLRASEQSQLYLVNQKDFERFKELQTQRMKEQKDQKKSQEAAPVKEDKAKQEEMKTLMLDQGTTGPAAPKENFVEVLKDWRGIHRLLKDRNRASEQKWKRVTFSDLCMYFVIVVLTFFIIYLRHLPDVYLLRYGVTHTLGCGVPGQCHGALAAVPSLPAVVSPVVNETTTTLVNETTTTAAVTTATTTVTTQTGTFTTTATNENDTSTTTTTTTDVAQVWLAALLSACSGGSGTSSCEAQLGSLAAYQMAPLQLALAEACGAGNAGGASCAGLTLALEAAAAQGSPCTQDFLAIRRQEDFWDWLGRSFHKQIFDPTSKLRQYYQPVGKMRIRQQKAARRTCPRSVPRQFERNCYFVEVTETTQDRATMDVDGETQEFFLPSELMWQPARGDTAYLYGEMQHVYDGAGYSLELSMEPGSSIQDYLVWARERWIDETTRMIVVELTLANYNLGGYLSAAFLLEISPSGAVWPSMTVLPFWAGDGTAAVVLEWCRAVIVILYIFMLRTYRKVKEKEDAGKSGLEYVFSFQGLVDEATVGAVVAAWYMRVVIPAPPFPETVTGFRAYSQFAANTENLSVCEAAVFALLMVRLALFSRMQPTVYRFSKMLAKSMLWFVFAAAALLPVFLGFVFLANAIWSPYIREFSTWTNAFLTCVLAVWQSFKHPELMHEKALSGWAIPFLGFFYLLMTAFLMNIFLAILVHAYFETELLEGSDPDGDRWSSDQWLDWVLWGPVYKRLTKRDPGSSRMKGYAEAESDGESSSSSSSDEGEK